MPVITLKIGVGERSFLEMGSCQKGPFLDILERERASRETHRNEESESDHFPEVLDTSGILDIFTVNPPSLAHPFPPKVLFLAPQIRLKATLLRRGKATCRGWVGEGSLPEWRIEMVSEQSSPEHEHYSIQCLSNFGHVWHVGGRSSGTSKMRQNYLPIGLLGSHFSKHCWELLFGKGGTRPFATRPFARKGRNIAGTELWTERTLAHREHCHCSAVEIRLPPSKKKRSHYLPS